METKRSHRVWLAGSVAAVSFAAGLALALWDKPAVDAVPRVIGPVLIVAGLFLLTSRNIIKRDGGVRTELQIRTEQVVIRRIRFQGASGILFGVAQVFPDLGVRIALTLCAATVGWAGVFKRPRRFFAFENPAD